MTDVTAPFELRKLILKWSRGVSGGTVEDSDAITFHLAKITGGAIDAGWTAGDYATCEGKFDTWWTSQKVWHPAFMTLAEYRWFKDGPVFSPADGAPGPPNPSQRITARAVTGTGSVASGTLPPQIAMTITEVTTLRKRWGRYYLPSPVPVGTAGVMTAQGRIDPTSVGLILGIQVTLYNALRAAGFRPVVFSRERSSHAGAGGTVIPHHDATAYEVLSLQMDNLFDVQRSRRYGGPTQRNVTVLT